VRVDVGAHLDLFDLDDLLVLARFSRLLLVGVFQLAQVEDLADRRICVRGDFNEIEAGFFGEKQRVVDGNIAEIAAVGADELDAGDPDVPVGARAVFCRRRCFEWSANGRVLLAVVDAVRSNENLCRSNEAAVNSTLAGKNHPGVRRSA